jgi:hypothetical protein
MLDRQISLFKVDTSAFLTKEEKNERKRLIRLKKIHKKIYDTKLHYKESITKTVSKLKREKKDGCILSKYEEYFLWFDKEIKSEEERWKKYISDNSKNILEYNKTHKDKIIRCLDERYLSYVDQEDGDRKINISNVIAMFESTLSRSFDIKTNELTYGIFVLEIFYYDIAENLILDGFNYNNKHYVYFSSSAGQIRTKKAVFVEEEKYESCKLKLMCGLTVDKINEKGGMNINKFLAYLALANSATDLWEDVLGVPFDIDRSIVVDDFETMVNCKVDNIDYKSYEITPDVVMDIPITHTDGSGMILPSLSKKNFMVRMPFIKGLLGSFDYKKFIKTYNCSSKIRDIWGKEYDIFDDDIQVIFTKSQLKMYKYYDSWDEYKYYFKKYNCEAGICNIEEDSISNAKINYQMLQTLYDATDKEISDMCKFANKKIETISDSLENALDFFGVDLDDDDESKKDWFQKSLKIYPELLNDPASKADLRDLKNSMIKKYRSAKLDVTGKFTFVVPDLYAFCERLFMGVESPIGLLANGEVFCRLYKNKEKLDCLRSPHLYIEHAVRKNVCNKKFRCTRLDEWFTTDAIYTSVHDPISRILQFDVDGDRLLVLAQEKLINIAERCMQGVNPLYYEMKKANAEMITCENIFKGLKLAFTGGRIGGISNDITKIWNSGNITQESLNAVRWLCMETNFTIDYAKTLFKPTRPQHVDQILKRYSNQKVPYFFYYAKDKSLEQVEPINDSTINKIVNEIKDNKKQFKNIKRLDKVDYKLFLKDKNDFYYNDEVNAVFDRWNKKYGNNIKLDEDDNKDKNNINAVCMQVKSDLNKIEPNDDKVINSLVSFLYKKPSTRKKKLLWYIYGEQIYNNLCENVDYKNICRKCGKRTDEVLYRGKCRSCRGKEVNKLNGKKSMVCVDCGCVFNVQSTNMRSKRCDRCSEIHKDYLHKLRQSKYRNKKSDAFQTSE